MKIFEKICSHEQVLFCNHEESGLRAIIAIHDTTLGPALGGCRMRPYGTEEEALEDALRLSRGMTYKCAAADVDFGGGKAVIIGDPNKDKTPELFRAFGKFVESLNGRFYTGTDMGTLPEDFVHAAKESNCIVGLEEEHGGSGDSSVPTASGVLQGLRATANHLWGSDSLSGKTFTVQGLGKVGMKIVEQLWEEGALVIATDVNEVSLALAEKKAEAGGYSLQIVGTDQIYSAEADMYIPCALGGVINDKTIPQLTVRAVVGSANNQLLEERHGEALQKRSILYAPDYVVNAGGLIQVADELYGSNKARVLKKTKAIYDMVQRIFRYSEDQNVSSMEAADRLTEMKLQRVKNINGLYVRSRTPKWDIRN
jgi:phenylalanine dehydrogenase